jgi:vacuolar-type H+-ATPase subunit E/Vma4
MLDSMEGGLTEVKNVAYQSYTAQLQAQIDYAAASGQSYELIVNPNTMASGPLREAINKIGGSIVRFDPVTGGFSPY